ncbi:MAG TPA: AMP-binding protein [Vicinamibacterales bacterium]|nr:AMP-binding protein [Vicinamibacterales bacterium]
MKDAGLTAAGKAFLAARNLVLRHRLDREAAVREFRWPALDRFNWALDYFDAIASGNDAPALHIVDDDGGEHVRSFAQMARRSNQVANFLREHGVRRMDCVLLMLGNEVALWETLLAAMKLGAIVSPASSLLTPLDLQDRVDRGHVRHVIAGSALVHKFDHIKGELTRVAVGYDVPGWTSYAASEASPSMFEPTGVTLAADPLLLYFTSGTTARPKMVLHTHQSYPVGHLSTLFFTGLQPGDRHWNISSPGWAKHAWSSFFAPWNAEATVFMYNYERFQAKRVLQALVAHRVTTMCAPPTVWRLLVQEPLAGYPVAIREAMSAGEPLNPEVIDQVRQAWGVTIRDGYGQTETTALVGNPPGQPLKPGSMGRPLVGCPIVLLDTDDKPADEGEVCIQLSGNPLNLTAGYYGDDGRTAGAMRDGYYRTGDVAARDADGYLTFVGRADDVFKAADYRISPFELESALIEHPAIVEAAVIPSPDPVRHMVPKAVVTIAEGYEPGRELALEIFTFARTVLAPYKRIRRLEFAPLPKTISGKIRRVELRGVEEERRARGERAPMEFFEEDFSVE